MHFSAHWLIEICRFRGSRFQSLLQMVLKSVVMHPTVGQSHCHKYVIHLAICCSHHPHSQEVDVE